jgi:hypothetical protein
MNKLIDTSEVDALFKKVTGNKQKTVLRKATRSAA